jgi:replicative DNA helicase
MTITTAAATNGYDERTPPHNTAAERVLLGAMMLSQDVISDVTDLVSPNDYYHPRHTPIHQAITHLYAHGQPTDPIAVADRLRATGELAKAGGDIYLVECRETVPVAAHARHFAGIVADAATRRRVIEAGTRIVQMGYTGSDDTTAMVDRAQAELHRATTGRATTDPIRVGTLLSSLMDRIEAAGANKGYLRGLPTGLVDLDRLTTGLLPGQLIVVAGRPAMGKSVFGLDLLRACALRAEQPALQFSLEMSRDEVTDRLVSAEARIPYQLIKSGHLSDTDWTRLARAAGERIDNAPLFIDDTSGLGLGELRGKARRIQQRHGLSLIVVDYLQLMGTVQRRGSDTREREVADLSRGLKILAGELHVPIVAISQLNRGPETRMDKRPHMSDLRESGAIENDADIVILVYREDYYNKESARAGEVDLIVAKNRSGPQDTITAAAQLHFQRFVDCAVD